MRRRSRLLWGYVFFLVALSLTALFLVALVKVRIEYFNLGYKIAEMEKQKAQLEEEIQAMNFELTRLQSIENLLKLNQSMKLDLVPPAQWKQKEKSAQ